MATAKKNTTTRIATDIATEKLTEARALLATRKAEHEQTEETHAELVARLTRGDDKISALDLATAHYAIERAALLLKAAENAIKPAENALDKAEAIDNPTLARWLARRIEADAFAFGLYGLSVKVTTDEPTEPGVYLSQPNATKVNPQTGMLSGRVDLRVITPNGAGIDGAAILAGLAAIESEGLALVKPRAFPSPNGCRAAADITNLKPDLPTLPAEVDADALRTFGFNLANDIARRGGKYNPRNADPYGGGAYGGNGLWGDVSVSNIGHALEGVTITQQERDGDQEHRTVRVEINLTSKRVRADEVAEYTDAAVAGLVDEFAAGIGRVKAARVVSRKLTTEDPRPGQEFTNLSRIAVRVVVEVDAAARIA